MRSPEKDPTGHNNSGSGSTLRSRIRVLSVLTVLALFAMVVLILPSLDDRDQQWVRCDVVGANATRGSNHSSYPWFIKFETKQCGTIFYTDVVDRQQVQELAASFEPGDYEFLLGWVSRLDIDYYVPFIETSAQDYRQL